MALKWDTVRSGKNLNFLPCLSLIFSMRFWLLNKCRCSSRDFFVDSLGSYLMTIWGWSTEVTLSKGWTTKVVPLIDQTPCCNTKWILMINTFLYSYSLGVTYKPFANVNWSRETFVRQLKRARFFHLCKTNFILLLSEIQMLQMVCNFMWNVL